MKKRICLFAGYDKNNTIQKYVVYYIEQLSKFCDVYYYGDFDGDRKELSKIERFVKKAYLKRHKKYDFGSWQELINEIGWDKIQEYDELILANDSCYAPLFPFEKLFKKMDNLDNDFWGASGGYIKNVHIQSFFIVFKKQILETDILNKFFKGVKQEESLEKVVENYEDKLTKLLEDNGYKYNTYIPYGDFVFHPYYETWNCIKYKKFPFLKAKAFTKDFNTTVGIKDWANFIKKETKYDYKLIEEHLLSKGISMEESKALTLRNVNTEEKVYRFLKIKCIIKKVLSPIIKRIKNKKMK